MKYVLLLLALVIIIVNFGPRKTAFDYPTHPHYHAGFVVIQDGEIKDYSDPRYMHASPCNEESHSTDEQIEKAHLHDGVGDVVHIHRDDATWGDLFVNAKIDIGEYAYAIDTKGKIIENILQKEIQDGESIVIIDGEDPKDIEEVLKNAVASERIKKVGEQSETCS